MKVRIVVNRDETQFDVTVPNSFDVLSSFTSILDAVRWCMKNNYEFTIYYALWNMEK